MYAHILEAIYRIYFPGNKYPNWVHKIANYNTILKSKDFESIVWEDDSTPSSSEAAATAAAGAAGTGQQPPPAQQTATTASS